MIVDRYGRPVTGLRISVTDSCNLRCIFCHREGAGAVGGRDQMTPEEIERIVRVAMELGVRSVKLTGGEPMMREDILEIVERLGRLGLSDLSMTTNGFRIAELAGELRSRGLKRVNISLHTLDPAKYAALTGVGDPRAGGALLRAAVEGVRRSIEVGLNPVKINVVVMRGFNEGELERLIRFASEMDSGGRLIIQLIELVECGSASAAFQSHYYDLSKLEEEVGTRAVERVVRRLHFRTQYLLPEGVWIEFVRPTGRHVFCMNDTRLRITHDGRFKPCLMRDDNLIDFLGAMRAGATDEEIKKLFIEAVRLREPFWRPPGIDDRGS